MWWVLHQRNRNTTWHTHRRTHEQFKTGVMEKSRLAKHAYKEGHLIQCKEAKGVQIVSHMACMRNPFSQPILEMYTIWIPLICEEVGRLQDSSLYKPGSSK
jgi:hypothetical protein